MIALPRQARDKDRESHHPKTGGVFSALFWSFPYVCPEPVLAKCSLLYINGSKRPFSLSQRTGAIEAYITTGASSTGGGAARSRPNDAARIAAGVQRPTASADGGAPIAPARMRKVRQRQFLSTLNLKMISLPRQARDKHRKKLKQVPFSCRLRRRSSTRSVRAI